jgi:hypothetical protein
VFDPRSRQLFFAILAKDQVPQPQKKKKKEKKGGEAGYRSLCLMHAKHALYHLSYIPELLLVAVTSPLSQNFNLEIQIANHTKKKVG